ncbi:MAG: MCE family protein [Leptonema sp. (in: Bacteria)]|nr:MCE family protein [Leptonema sp. (in: bacteria)]
MRENWKEATFGISFWVAMSLLLLYTIVLPSEQDRKLQTYMPLFLESAQGLHEGSKVTILGVDYGTVMHLTYLPIDEKGRILTTQSTNHQVGQKVLAILAVQSQVELHSSYKISTRYATVIAEKLVDIDPGKGIIPDVLPIDYLTSQEVFLLMKEGRLDLESRVIPNAINYDDPLTAAADLVYENRLSIRQIFRNTREISDKINQGNGTISSLLNDANLMHQIEDGLLDTDLLVRDGRGLYESLRESRTTIDLLEGYLVPLITAAAGAP